MRGAPVCLMSSKAAGAWRHGLVTHGSINRAGSGVVAAGAAAQVFTASEWVVATAPLRRPLAVAAALHAQAAARALRAAASVAGPQQGMRGRRRWRSSHSRRSSSKRRRQAQPRLQQWQRPCPRVAGSGAGPPRWFRRSRCVNRGCGAVVYYMYHAPLAWVGSGGVQGCFDFNAQGVPALAEGDSVQPGPAPIPAGHARPLACWHLAALTNTAGAMKKLPLHPPCLPPSYPTPPPPPYFTPTHTSSHTHSPRSTRRMTPSPETPPARAAAARAAAPRAPPSPSSKNLRAMCWQRGRRR